ncbi:uncharacterized protein LOC143361050 isoform X2 [Halictus rubicundus]|uniref:uncharacterized protein LOC143361050 isoform X2 n=1 Tax=Halictus rubicundus TaxID=77578 RepID=UPI004035B188
MDVFKQNYSTYYNVLNFTGLWPYNHSLTAKLQRVVYSVVTLCCIVIQISTLRMADMSVYNCVMVMSYGFPMLLFFLRYVGFVVNFPVIKCMFENIEKDFVALQNPIEAGMLMKQIAETRRVIVALVGLMCLGVLILFSALLVPTILKSQRQIYYLNVFGFLYVERNHETDLVCFQILYISTIGLLSVACTEASLAVFSSYLCGLFEIASYRIQTAVNTMAKSEKSGILIDIRSAVDIHRRAVELALVISHEQHDVVLFSGDRGGCRIVRCQFISPSPCDERDEPTRKPCDHCDDCAGTRDNHAAKQL